MNISYAMLAQALKAAPGVTEKQVRAIFASVGGGQILFKHDEGSHVI
jgi:uncharacterized protein YneF (UPF0154 family)